MKNILSTFEELYKRKEISIQEMEFARFLYEMEPGDYIPILIGGVCISSHLDGHICTDIHQSKNHPVYGALLKDKSPEDIRDSLNRSKLAGDGKELTPLVIDDERVYLHKFSKYEQELADWLLDKVKVTNSLSNDSRIFNQVAVSSPDEEQDWQKIAVLLSLIKDLVIISGGPGTGKTYTIRKIIDALISSNPDEYSIALAAPTGKAAQRLAESLNIENFDNVEAPVTIHKLLGAIGNSGRFQHGQQNPLPFDAVIIDEASMLDITLWIRLIRSIPESTKLIVLGDKNQLASVEAGSILGDICLHADNSFSGEIATQVQGVTYSGEDVSPLNDAIVLLHKNYRFEERSGIQLLAEAINQGDGEEVIRLLTSHEQPELSVNGPSNEVINKLILKYILNPFEICLKSKDKFKDFNSYQILCALRNGPFGVEHLNMKAEKEIKRRYSIPGSKVWYNGRTIMMTKNDAGLKLKNGEIGICYETEEGLKLQFGGEEKQIDVSRVQNYEPAYATTVHKSQGSEYEHIAIILSNTTNRVLSKQLLYTSVTRARKSVLVVGSKSVISSTVQQSVVRRSGLGEKIWDK